MSTETPTLKPTATPTEAPTETATPEPTATSQASSGVMLAAPRLIPGPAPALVPLAAPLPTTHRVISYTYDSLYRLTDAEYSTGEYYHYTYDAVGNRLSLTTHQGVVNYAYLDNVTFGLRWLESLTQARSGR